MEDRLETNHTHPEHKSATLCMTSPAR